MNSSNPRPRDPKRAAILGFLAGVAAAAVVAAVLAWRLNWSAPAQVSGAILDTRPDSDFSAQQLQGRTIYYANCASCHGGPTGGDMMDYPPRHNANGHTWHHPDCELTQIIREGGDDMTAMMRQMMAPPNAPKMIAFKDKLSDAEIDAVLAYIKTMWSSYQQEAQADMTRGSCTS